MFPFLSLIVVLSQSLHKLAKNTEFEMLNSNPDSSQITVIITNVNKIIFTRLRMWII